jgi:hypothetical protein
MAREAPVDRLFETLAHPLRRHLLVAIYEADPGAGDEFDPIELLDSGRPSEPSVSEIKLVHHHLPKLTENGFLEWDQEAATVSPGANWDVVVSTVGVLQEHRAALPDDWLHASLRTERCTNC